MRDPIAVQGLKGRPGANARQGVVVSPRYRQHGGARAFARLRVWNPKCRAFDDRACACEPPDGRAWMKFVEGMAAQGAGPVRSPWFCGLRARYSLGAEARPARWDLNMWFWTPVYSRRRD
jgi:hypothetical protein